MVAASTPAGCVIGIDAGAGCVIGGIPPVCRSWAGAAECVDDDVPALQSLGSKARAGPRTRIRHGHDPVVRPAAAEFLSGAAIPDDVKPSDDQHHPVPR